MKAAVRAHAFLVSAVKHLPVICAKSWHTIISNFGHSFRAPYWSSFAANPCGGRRHEFQTTPTTPNIEVEMLLRYQRQLILRKGMASPFLPICFWAPVCSLAPLAVACPTGLELGLAVTGSAVTHTSSGPRSIASPRRGSQLCGTSGRPRWRAHDCSAG